MCGIVECDVHEEKRRTRELVAVISDVDMVCAHSLLVGWHSNRHVSSTEAGLQAHLSQL